MTRKELTTITNELMTIRVAGERNGQHPETMMNSFPDDQELRLRSACKGGVLARLA
jgi:hypothetical protein